MTDQEIKLSPAQKQGLDLIVQRIADTDSTWVEAGDIDPRVLRNLQGHHLIDFLRQGDDTHARLLPPGARYLGMEHPDEVIIATALKISVPEDDQGITLSDNSLPCVVDGCDQPRMVTPNGVTLTTCPDHRMSPATAIKPYTNGDKTVDKRPVKTVDKTPDAPPCADCDHARILELIRVMYPEVDDAVDILQRAEEARRMVEASRTARGDTS